MSKTKTLARKLGVISKSSLKETLRTASKSQSFSHVCVIDFEATCWSEKRLHRTQEIIEFPAVLLSVATGAVEGEFHHFIQPQENTTLSAFCTELTGISQAQVDNGIPLPVCLRLFNEWVCKLEKEKGIHFLRPLSNDKFLLKEQQTEEKLVAMATWSDWDLGVALHYECQRKQIRKASYFNQWIDLRATYKAFYDCKPAGLKGALCDLGLSFEGREHSGIDDARNTARLCWRMVGGGCVLRITKSLLPKGKKEATVLSVPNVSCPPLTPLLPAQPVNSVERETRSHSPTGGLCEDGRGPSADEETNKSLTSAEDHQFLSSIAGQLDFVEPSHGHAQAIPTPENSNFKRSCSIPCKRQAPLACPRDPLTPKSVNIITTHPTVGTQTGAV